MQRIFENIRTIALPNGRSKHVWRQRHPTLFASSEWKKAYGAGTVCRVVASIAEKMRATPHIRSLRTRYRDEFRIPTCKEYAPDVFAPRDATKRGRSASPARKARKIPQIPRIYGNDRNRRAIPASDERNRTTGKSVAGAQANFLFDSLGKSMRCR